jgi:hypothetical protein
MVPAVQKIFSFEMNIVSGIETIVWVKNTMVATSETKVRAAQKMVSVAPTMVFRQKTMERRLLTKGICHCSFSMGYFSLAGCFRAFFNDPQKPLLQIVWVNFDSSTRF